MNLKNSYLSICQIQKRERREKNNTNTHKSSPVHLKNLITLAGAAISHQQAKMSEERKQTHLEKSSTPFKKGSYKQPQQ